MGDFPTMTDQGTFVINGAERVVVSASWSARPGVYYSELEDPTSGRGLFSAKVIPNRGAWLEFETNNKDQLWVKVDRKRKIAATTLLRAVGYETRRGDPGAVRRDRHRPEHPYVANTLDKDVTHTQQEALIEVYKKLRPGDPPTGDNARQLVESLFFNFRRYDLGRVGRYKFNKKLAGVAERMGIELPVDQRTITREDIAAIVGHLIECNRGLHPQGRHRPPRQPPHPRQRRADPERVPDRPPAHGARRPRAHDDPGDRQGHAERAHQHPARSWRR